MKWTEYSSYTIVVQAIEVSSKLHDFGLQSRGCLLERGCLLDRHLFLTLHHTMGVGIFYERGSILDHLWYTQWLKNTLFKYLSKIIIAVTAIDGFLQSQTQIRLWDIIIIYYFSSWHLSVSPDQPLTTVWWPVSYSFTCTNSVLSPNKPRWKKW